MKDKLLILYLFCIFGGLFGITLFASSGKIYVMDGTGASEEELQEIEDALLIDTLKMDSADIEELTTDDDDGEILYLDDFFASPVNSSGKSQHSSSTGPVSTKKSNSSLIDRLKKEDTRWHVSSYTIHKNDNIWNIAKKFNTNHRYIIEYNNINSPDSVQAGTKIGVPNRKGIYYTVKSGDTVSEIAVDNSISISKLKKENSISDRIIIGQKLFLPDVSLPKKKTKTNTSTHKLVASSTNTTSSKSKSTKINNGLHFAWPTTVRTITSAFGLRIHPITKKRQFHNGIDIKVNTGTPVRASEAGTIIFSGWKTGYGYLVVIKHKNNYITVYAHNSKLKVKKGDRVSKGQLISLSGSSGLSTGPHLHFEIRKYETPLNPLRML